MISDDEFKCKINTCFHLEKEDKDCHVVLKQAIMQGKKSLKF